MILFIIKVVKNLKIKYFKNNKLNENNMNHNYHQIFIVPYRIYITDSYDYGFFERPPYSVYTDDVISNAIKDWDSSHVEQYAPKKLHIVSSKLYPTSDKRNFIIDLVSKYKLEIDELNILTKWLNSQLLDGWGEDFYHKEIDNFDDYYYSEHHFDNDDEFIVTYYVYGEIGWPGTIGSVKLKEYNKI